MIVAFVVAPAIASIVLMAYYTGCGCITYLLKEICDKGLMKKIYDHADKTMEGLADLYIVFLDNGPMGVVEYIGQGYADRAQTPEGVASITGEVSGLVVGGFAGKKFKTNISQKKAGVKAVEGGSTSFKFSEMTENEIAKVVENYRKKAPIEIPDIAKYKAKSMPGGYEQISYKWNDGTYKYEVRWHTRTSGAPEGQGNTWVVRRTIPGNGGTKPSTQFLIGENEWVEGWKWYDAINARKNGIATQAQIELLDKGHWKE